MRKLHREGANLCVADLNEDAGSELQKELGDRILFRKVDVTKEDQVCKRETKPPKQMFCVYSTVLNCTIMIMIYCLPLFMSDMIIYDCKYFFLYYDDYDDDSYFVDCSCSC